MRIWPAGFEDRETLCRNTFCLPKKVKRMTFSEGYNMSYRYNYRVSADGETTILDGEYLEGEPRGVTGKKTKEEHMALLNKFVSRVEYEPIIIDGEAKALINLETMLAQTTKSSANLRTVGWEECRAPCYCTMRD